MGCISSKQVRSPPRPQPDFDSTTTTVTVRHNGPASAHLDSLFLKRGGFGELEKIKEEPEKENEEDSVSSRNREPKKSRSTKKGSSEKKAVFSLRFGRYTEAEQIAAGWPPWLSAVAGEAVEGWLPLRADLFEKLDKVGQGTYSSVYRARDVETGRIVALKKVRFDTFQPESVRFMAREITILRRLDHQNIMKLEGLITNRLSCSIYLVFEYMEHDLSGLLSCHDIKFSDSQVEQLHKIFRLCGSPPDEYWKKSKLPLATMFKPQHPYVSSLRERCKEFPKSAVNLLETFLSIEPHKRGTASSALDSEYFITKPFACDPSSLPRYPPSKEIDAKIHEERSHICDGPFMGSEHACETKESDPVIQYRRKACARTRASGTSRNPRRSCKPLQESSSISKVEVGSATQFSRRNNGGHAHVLKAKGASESRELLRSSYDTVSEASQATEISQVDSIQSVPAVSASTDFAWAKKRRGNGISTRLRNQASSRVQNFNAFDPSSVLHSRLTSDSEEQENEEFSSKIRNDTQGGEACEALKRVTWRQQTQPYRSDLFDASDCHSQELSVTLCSSSIIDCKNLRFIVLCILVLKSAVNMKMYHRDKDEQMKRVPFSGPLLSYPHRLAEGQENHTRQTVHNRSRIYRG
ncbi:protein kinase superfamily protein [Actinidia rufa]|uniref:Protein kinase superfamily protein n=1 Tax=Actinidia rufa TaxID=165716 RepID=A0A7J0H937_9ERIC|nr:protein kinase superfamily protein [Actinidia rufa]